ncbi:hypothetical protein KFL_002660080 [Klebsormidium nitens]|uniref:Uncharacterized protein n=1 Tax=Klebsormidium nitens TaxID=105231 RepID=A0A1Y1I9C7_KLENI|nr:hypothetical protein KFL_002660080 [Klebsormidium nitens]|eukprot:GAQ86029.1 hypothetical protein KFL_002660080 [Klebsormidium nitens]
MPSNLVRFHPASIRRLSGCQQVNDNFHQTSLPMWPPVQEPGRSKALSVIKTDILSTYIDDKKAVDEACKRVGFWYWCNGRKKGRPKEVYCLCVKNPELIDRLKEDEYVKLDETKEVKKGVKKRVNFNERGMCSINGEEWVLYYVGKFVLGLSKPVPEVEGEAGVKKRVKKETAAKKKDEIRAGQWKARQLEGPGQGERSAGLHRARKRNDRNEGERWKRKAVDDEEDEGAGPGLSKRTRNMQSAERNRKERKRKERAAGWKRKKVESSEDGGAGPGHGASAVASVSVRKKHGTEQNGSERNKGSKGKRTELDAGCVRGRGARARRQRNDGSQEWKAKSVESSSEEEDVPINERQRKRNRKDQAVKHVSSETESDDEAGRCVGKKRCERRSGKGVARIVSKAADRGRMTKRHVASSGVGGLTSRAKGKPPVRRRVPLRAVPPRIGKATRKGDPAGGAGRIPAAKGAGKSFESEKQDEDSSSSDKVLAAFGKRGCGSRKPLKKPGDLQRNRFGRLEEAGLDPPSKSSLVGPGQKKMDKTRGLELPNDILRHDKVFLQPGLATGSRMAEIDASKTGAKGATANYNTQTARAQTAEIDGKKGAAGAVTGEKLFRAECEYESSGGRPVESPDWVKIFMAEEPGDQGEGNEGGESPRSAQSAPGSREGQASEKRQLTSPEGVRPKVVSPEKAMGGLEVPGQKGGDSAFPVNKEPHSVGGINPPSKSCDKRATGFECGARDTRLLGGLHHQLEREATDPRFAKEGETLSVASPRSTGELSVGRADPAKREAVELLGGAPKQVGGAFASKQPDARPLDAAEGAADSGGAGDAAGIEAADLL